MSFFLTNYVFLLLFDSVSRLNTSDFMVKTGSVSDSAASSPSLLTLYGIFFLASLPLSSLLRS